MLIFSDNQELAYNFLGKSITEVSAGIPVPDDLELIRNSILPSKDIYRFESDNEDWEYLFLVKETDESQFDLLVKLNSGNSKLPDGIICIAGKGNGFHGFRNRSWEAVAGNIHLSLFFKPKTNFQYFHAGLLIASAVSVVETIDKIPGLQNRAKTKWVNDITIDGAKVCGVITQSSSTGNNLSGATIGIGLNVQSQPNILKDQFTKQAVCLADLVEPDLCKIDTVLCNLLSSLRKNLNFLNDDQYPLLYNKYCQRSAVIGKKAAIYSDPVDGKSEELIKGRVTGIGKNLELYFEGVSEPKRSGRLALLE